MSGNNMESLLMGGDDSSSGESDEEVNVPMGTSNTAASTVAAKTSPTQPVPSPAPAGNTSAATGSTSQAEQMARLKSLYSASKAGSGSSAATAASSPRPSQLTGQQQQQVQQQYQNPSTNQYPQQQQQQQQQHSTSRSYPQQQSQVQPQYRQSYPPPVQQNRQSSQTMPNRQPQPQQMQLQHHQHRPPSQHPTSTQQQQINIAQGGRPSVRTDTFDPTPISQIKQRSAQHRMAHQQQQQQQQQQQPTNLGTSGSGTYSQNVSHRSTSGHSQGSGGAGTVPVAQRVGGRNDVPMDPEELKKQKNKEKERFLMFTRVLIKYLEQKDPTLHAKAKLVIKDCAERNRRQEPGFESVTVSMSRRLKELVGQNYWKKAQDYLVHFIEQKRKQQQQQLQQQQQQRTAGGSGSTTAGRESASTLTQQQKKEQYLALKKKQHAAAQARGGGTTDVAAPTIDNLRQEIHQQREQLAGKSLPQGTAPSDMGTATGKSAADSAPTTTTVKGGKKQTRRKSGESSKTASRKTSTGASTSKTGATPTTTPAPAPAQAVAPPPKPVDVEEPPRDYQEFMELIDHALDYDWPCIGQLLGDKKTLNLSEEEVKLLYGDSPPYSVKKKTSSPSKPNIVDDEDGRFSTEARSGEKDSSKNILPRPGWGRKNVLSVRAAWSRIRLKEQKAKEQLAANSAPVVAGGLLTLPPVPQTGGSFSHSNESSRPEGMPLAEKPWVNEETAEQDATLALLSEGCQIYLKGVLEKAIQSARQRQNLDGIRLWHQQYAAAKAAAMAAKDKEDKSDEQSKKPPLSLRLGCDVSRQVAQAQGNAAMTVKRMEEALERQTGISSRARDLRGETLLEATSMDDLAWRPLLKEGATKAEYVAKRSFEIYGGKEAKDPPFGRVPKKAKLVVDDLIMGSKLSLEGPYQKAYTASSFISF